MFFAIWFLFGLIGAIMCVINDHNKNGRTDVSFEFALAFIVFTVFGFISFVFALDDTKMLSKTIFTTKEE